MLAAAMSTRCEADAGAFREVEAALVGGSRTWKSPRNEYFKRSRNLPFAIHEVLRIRRLTQDLLLAHYIAPLSARGMRPLQDSPQ
jgi:hypothetical protein